MKQKLGLGCSLLGHPRFLLLDEPGVGVDPISRRELMKMVRGLAQDGITILWSTSYLDEAEHFDTVLVLDEGKLLYAGPPANLTKTVAGDAFFVQRTRLAPRPLLRSILKSGIPVTDAVIWGNQVRVVIQDKAVQKKFARYLKPTSARFEDAVINRLGGCPLNVSEVAQNVSVSSGKAVVIEARHLTKRYGSFTAAQDITFQIKRGEIFGLVGAQWRR